MQMTNQLAEALMFLIFLLAGYSLAKLWKKGKIMTGLLSFSIGFALYLAGKSFIFPFL
jgi:hypothetical protein